MRSIVAACKNYILPYYQSFFVKGYLLVIALLLATVVYLNYQVGFPKFSNSFASFLFDFSLYAIPFAGAYCLQYFFYRDGITFFKKKFLLLLFLAPVFFALRVNAKIFEVNGALVASRYLVSSLNYLVRALLLVAMAAAYWYAKDRRQLPLYGIAKAGNGHIYLIMFALMIPLVMLASARESFALVYPKSFYEAGLNADSSIYRYIFFEVCYGFDFVSIEFFFRGFLIFAFAKYAGMRAIVPAACFYCCIHLGKPMPEAISSFFGGLLLGIISYNTKSIRGGLFIHLGIAWMMEWLAWFIHHT